MTIEQITRAEEMQKLAKGLIAEIGEAARAVVETMRVEREAIRAHDEERAQTVDSLVGNPNPLTNKPHSATSAAEAADRAENVREKKAARQRAEDDRILAWAAYEQARLQARLAVEMIHTMPSEG